MGPSTKASQLVSPLPTWPLQFTFLAGARRSLENMGGINHSPAETFHGFPVAPKSKFKLLPCPVRADQCGPCLSDPAPPHPLPAHSGLNSRSFTQTHSVFSSPGPLHLLFIPVAGRSSLLPVTLHRDLPRSPCLKQPSHHCLCHSVLFLPNIYHY